MTAKKRVLLVDDDHDFVLVLTAILARHDFEVVTAADAVSAISVAAKHMPDVVLLDMRLPGGEGITVMQRLHSLPQVTGMPVIILTGVDPEAGRQQALAAGAAGFLAKPVTEEALLEALGQITAASDETEVADDGAGHRVLVIDDDRDLLVSLVGLLRARGYEVVAAADAISAIATAAKQRPDVVLLDLGLPGGDGLTVMERLRGLPQMAVVPVVILTGLDPERYRDRAIAAGAAAFLRKPVSDGELLRTLAEALHPARQG
jgi:CheY-like chemotaxis protein